MIKYLPESTGIVSFVRERGGMALKMQILYGIEAFPKWIK
jgi:hypothetical protein